MVSFAVSHAAAIDTARGEGSQTAGLGRVDEKLFAERSSKS